MTKQSLLLFLLLCINSVLFAQAPQRIEVKGKIFVDVEDVEGVTVFNSSSNKGTITNDKGEFKIDVALNDKIEVSALQFVPFKLTVSQEVLDKKQLLIYLAERVNNLDEVVLLPHDLTGNLTVDTESVQVFKPFVFVMPENINAYDLPPDYKTGVVNTAIQQPIQYQADLGEIIKLAAKLFKSKKPKYEPEKAKYKAISDAYSTNYFIRNFDIPRGKVEAFISFIETNNFDFILLNESNEIQFIEHVLNQRLLFFNIEGEKN